MLQVMKDIGGIEVPEFLARLAPELANGVQASGGDGRSSDQAGGPAGSVPSSETADVGQQPQPEVAETPPQSRPPKEKG